MNNSLRGAQCSDDKWKQIPSSISTKAQMTEKERTKRRGTPGTEQSSERDEMKILSCSIKQRNMLFWGYQWTVRNRWAILVVKNPPKKDDAIWKPAMALLSAWISNMILARQPTQTTWTTHFCFQSLLTLSYCTIWIRENSNFPIWTHMNSIY